MCWLGIIMYVFLDVIEFFSKAPSCVWISTWCFFLIPPLKTNKSTENWWLEDDISFLVFFEHQWWGCWICCLWNMYCIFIYIYITYDIGNPHIQIDGWNMMEGLCWCPSFFRNARMHSFRAQGGKNLDAGTLAAQCQREAWGSTIYWTTSQK